MGEHEMEAFGAAIPPSLWRVLMCVFDLGSADASHIAEHLNTKYEVECHPKTAGVLLLRLLDRNLVEAVAPRGVGRGRPQHIYSPKVSKEAALKGQFRQFLEQYLVREDKDLEILESMIRQRRSSLAPS